MISSSSVVLPATIKVDAAIVGAAKATTALSALVAAKDVVSAASKDVILPIGTANSILADGEMLVRMFLALPWCIRALLAVLVGPYGRVRKAAFLREYATLMAAGPSVLEGNFVLVAKTEAPVIKAIDPSKLPPVAPFFLQAVADAIQTKGSGLSTVFSTLGWNKPSMPPYLFTWVGGELASLLDFPCAPRTSAGKLDRTQPVYKRVFLAFYCLNLVQTVGVDAGKAKEAAGKMVKALGLQKGAGHNVQISGDATWLERKLPDAADPLRAAIVAACDGYVAF